MKKINIKKNIIKKLYQQKSIYEIAEYLNIGATTIRRKMIEFNIKRRNSKEASKKAYENKKRYMQTVKGAVAHSKKMKGHSHNRIFEYNRSFFSVWGNDMSYTSGLLAADGCIYNNRVILTLKDKEILEKIANKIGKKKIKSNNKYYNLTYSSHEMANDLNLIGITPRKTFTLQAPRGINKKYIPEFIRGFFDGDGCFAYNKTNNNWISCFTNASYNILEWIHQQLPVSGGSIRKKTKTCWELRYGQSDSLKLGYFIYKNVSINDLFLDRKYKLFNKIKSHV